MSSQNVLQLYNKVVEDVINGVRDAFQDEQVDEQVLQDLKSLWETKIQASKATESHRQSVRAPIPMVTAGFPGGTRIAPAAAGRAHIQPHPGSVQQPGTAVRAPIGGITYQPTPAAHAAQMALPAGLIQQHINVNGATGTRTITLQTEKGPQQFIVSSNVAPAGQPTQQNIRQLDGPTDSTSDEDNDEDDPDDDDDEDDEEERDEDAPEEDPLNSNDDDSDDDTNDLFCTENVVVCQFDKVTRSKNKWKFNLKDGIMNVDGKDMVFQKATGDAEW